MVRLEEISDPRHQSYIVYSSRVLLATRILSAVFYINSMRKTSEEFRGRIHNGVDRHRDRWYTKGKANEGMG